MGIDEWSGPTAEYITRSARIEAKRLIEDAGFTSSDIEDLQQELTLDVLQRLPRFDPSRASMKTFISRLIVHRAKDMIAYRRAAKRDQRVTVPLPPLDGEDDARPPESLTIDPRAPLHLSLDLERLIAQLPPALQELCQDLATQTVTEVSRETGVPRSTIYERIARVRAHLERAGFGNGSK